MVVVGSGSAGRGGLGLIVVMIEVVLLVVMVLHDLAISCAVPTFNSGLVVISHVVTD